MAEYESDTTDTTVGFGEINYAFAAATTPLSDFGGDEQSYDANVHGDEEDEEQDESEEEDDDDEDQPQVQERVVQADGSVVITIKGSGDGSTKRSKKSSSKRSKKQPRKAQPSTATKLTAVALNAMATAAVSSGTAHAPGAIQTGQWSAGLFDCFDFCVPNCFMATFCPCISAAQIASRVGFKYTTVLLVFGIAVALELLMYILAIATMQTGDRLTYSYAYGYAYYNLESGATLTAWAYVGFVISFILFVAYWQLRTRVRATFQVPGDQVGDFCLSLFCSCCSLAQMATHVKSYKPGSCDFGAPDELAAYTD